MHPIDQNITDSFDEFSSAMYREPKSSWALSLRGFGRAVAVQPLLVQILLILLLLIGVAGLIVIWLNGGTDHMRFSPAPYRLSTCDSSDCVPPYWVSLRVDRARMRKGPSQDFPVLWEYRREGLPLQILERYKNWRRVVDPDGDTGWMAAHLLSRRRTAIIVGDRRAVHIAPDDTTSIVYHIGSGAVVRLESCNDGWCLFTRERHKGWIRTDHIWGD